MADISLCMDSGFRNTCSEQSQQGEHAAAAPSVDETDAQSDAASEDIYTTSENVIRIHYENSHSHTRKTTIQQHSYLH